mgnify:CR=1 FL=1
MSTCYRMTANSLVTPPLETYRNPPQHPTLNTHVRKLTGGSWTLPDVTQELQCLGYQSPLSSLVDLCSIVSLSCLDISPVSLEFGINQTSVSKFWCFCISFSIRLSIYTEWVACIGLTKDMGAFHVCHPTLLNSHAPDPILHRQAIWD